MFKVLKTTITLIGLCIVGCFPLLIYGYIFTSCDSNYKHDVFGRDTLHKLQSEQVLRYGKNYIPSEQDIAWHDSVWGILEKQKGPRFNLESRIYYDGLNEEMIPKGIINHILDNYRKIRLLPLGDGDSLYLSGEIVEQIIDRNAFSLDEEIYDY